MSDVLVDDFAAPSTCFPSSSLTDIRPVDTANSSSVTSTSRGTIRAHLRARAACSITCTLSSNPHRCEAGGVRGATPFGGADSFSWCKMSATSAP
eukprot:2641329-Prymnesium_polylepis.1